MRCQPTRIKIGDAEFDSCIYDEIAEFRNVTVKVLKCRKCGHIEIEWIRQDDTEVVKEEK